MMALRNTSPVNRKTSVVQILLMIVAVVFLNQ
jgi:hypothetical protein